VTDEKGRCTLGSCAGSNRGSLCVEGGGWAPPRELESAARVRVAGRLWAARTARAPWPCGTPPLKRGPSRFSCRPRCAGAARRGSAARPTRAEAGRAGGGVCAACARRAVCRGSDCRAERRGVCPLRAPASGRFLGTARGRARDRNKSARVAHRTVSSPPSRHRSARARPTRARSRGARLAPSPSRA